MSTTHERILILDFGSQYTQLIARRVRELGVYSEIHPCSLPLAAVRELEPKGIVLSGGPDSVYRDGAPHVDDAVFDLGVPLLGICYGMQLMTARLGGKVEPGGTREYGPAKVEVVDGASRLFRDLAAEHDVWASHGDNRLLNLVMLYFQVLSTSY